MHTIETVLFYVFSAVLLLAAFRVITARNTVHAVMFLVLAFFQAASIWLLLGAEFLAVVLVLVYVGAVMVLFLFVLMMINIDTETVRAGFWRHFPLAAFIGLLFMVELAGVFLLSYHRVTEPLPVRGADGAPLAAGVANTNALGQVLYTHYLYPVQIAAVLLLVAIVAAIALTLRTRKDSKRQSVSWQVGVKAKDRLRVLKMDATRAAPEPAAAEEEQAP